LYRRSVTVPVMVAVLPPITDEAERTTLIRLAGWTVKVAVFGTLLNVPVITEVDELDTPNVVMVNVADVAPAAIVTLAGTVATVVVPEVSVTTKPPAGAGPVIVAVPVEGLPPTTDVGDKLTELMAGGLTVSVVFTLAVPCVAVIVATVLVATAVVVTVNVAVVAPAATVTFAGTVAAEALDVRFTVDPPAGAGALSVTVPVEEVPPVTVEGETVTLESDPALIVRVAVAVTTPWFADNVLAEIVAL